MKSNFRDVLERKLFQMAVSEMKVRSW